MAAGPAPWPLLAPAAHLVPPGEVIVLARRASLWYVLLARLEWLLAMAVVTAGALLLGAHTWAGVDAWLLIASGALAASLLLLYLSLDWMTRLYLLTDRRVIRVQGIIRQTTVDVALEHVENLALARSARERLFGLGTLWFASAAASIGEFAWAYVSDPAQVLQVVRETQARYKRHDLQ